MRGGKVDEIRGDEGKGSREKKKRVRGSEGRSNESKGK